MAPRCFLLLVGMIVPLVSVAFIPGSQAADQYQLHEATAATCAALVGRGDIISALQHAEGDELNQLILTNTEGWPPRFNEYARSPAALLLRAYAEGAFINDQASYPAAVCTTLKPLLAAARSGATVRDAGGTIEGGFLLDTCAAGLCLPPAIDAIGDRCDFGVFDVPVQNAC